MKRTQLRRSLLLAGGLNAMLNYPRYSHELLWWGDCLVQAGFECWACLGDGKVTDRPTPRIKLTSADRNIVLDALNWLSKIDDGDLGLLVVSNHGSTTGICLWGTDILEPIEINQALAASKGPKALIMGQCHGGVFRSLANNHTVVLSACTENESSWACPSPPGINYDEFLYQLGTALFGAPKDAMQIGPARRPLSLLDAFNWARLQDRRQAPPNQETPMIFDPSNLASKIFLSME